MRRQAQAGFTIVELMIATAVFSLTLVIILGVVIQIGKMYYKGITTSRTQEVARSIVDHVGQRLQGSNAIAMDDPGIGSSLISDGQEGVFCIDKTRYRMVNNRQVSSTPDASLKQKRHAMWVDNNGSGIWDHGCKLSTTKLDDPDPGDDGNDLVPENMRLAAFEITPINAATWRIKVRVVYGDQDLLEHSDGVTPQSDDPSKTVCKGGQLGTQFCAVSEIETIVSRRLAL